MVKKKILWLSDFSRSFTGYAKNAKQVLTYLHKTGKYEIIEYACHPVEWEDSKLDALPWKGYGAVPKSRQLQSEIEETPGAINAVKYGHFYLNEIITKEKPDIFIGANDFWAFNGLYDEPWWNDINCALWTTIDSLPIYKDALANAGKIENFWVWSKFAETEMHRLGHKHVKTIHGAFDTNNFKPLPNKQELRARHGIAEDDFIVGFVFRNQVRKLVGTLLEGYSIHKKLNSKTKCKLLLHTSWTTGWKIEDFIEEFGIDPKDVLATHVCSSCGGYSIKPYEGEDKKCGLCGGVNTLVTPNTNLGVDDGAMAEIYNMMDFYVHPVTSGGLEMPIVEAMMCGVPVATSNYACGKEYCEQDFVDNIDHTTYREFSSQFIKAQPCPHHIAQIMGDAQNEDLTERSTQSNEWAKEEYSKEKTCKQIEAWLDSCETPKHAYDLENRYGNEKYPNKNISDDTEWAIDLIKGVFHVQETEDSESVKQVVAKLKSSSTREEVYNKTISAAQKLNGVHRKEDVKEYFDEKDTDTAYFVMPDRASEKMLCWKKLLTLKEKHKKVFLVGEEEDSALFEEVGDFEVIPRNDRSEKMEWAFSLKNKEGEKRVKTFAAIEGGVYREYNNG